MDPDIDVALRSGPHLDMYPDADMDPYADMNLDAVLGSCPDIDRDLEPGPPEDPGPSPEQEQELPADPFPDLDLLGAGHPSRAA